MILVLFGCAATAIAGTTIGFTGISPAFGLASVFVAAPQVAGFVAGIVHAAGFTRAEA